MASLAKRNRTHRVAFIHGGRDRRRRMPACEPLEDRRLLSSVVPDGLASEARGIGATIRAPSLFVEPQAGRGPILAVINAARSQIRLGICNVSDPQIIDSLGAAEARGVNVRVIVDQADYLAKPDERTEIAALLDAHVSVHLSNPVFPQSFEKELVVDQKIVLIMTMCLVPATFQDTRDFGLVVADRGVIREITSVFDTDWAFSAPPGQATPAYNPTPALRAPNLIWGPTDATAKLSGLIQSARRSIDVTTELLDDPYLEGQLIAAAQRGVNVRLIAPLTARAGLSNAAQLAFLESHGVHVRVTTDLTPSPNAPPYMHAKTMVVDGRTAYLGSIDLDTTAATQDRELGVLFGQRTLVNPLKTQFQNDWEHARISLL